MIYYNLYSIPQFSEFIQTKQLNNNYYSVDECYTKENNKYSIVKYNKGLLTNDLVNSYGLLRSVILSEFNNILCFSPPKSINADTFITKYPCKDDTIIAEEFIEGTMINVFFDHIHGSWQIATKNTVGGNVSFYKWSKTFSEMFFEACVYCQLNIQLLSPNFCYSFILQHPENRIVVPFKVPHLYLIAVYSINHTNNTIAIFESDIDEVRKNGLWNITKVEFPIKYEFATYTELIEKFASPNTPYDILGIVIKNTSTGERTKIRNPIYEEVRHLRGNQPKLQYQYLTLRHSGKLAEFLKYYPETKTEMSKFRDQVHMFTNTLHKNYIACYVKKEKPLKDFSAQYRTHMYKLHQIFLNELREKKLFVTNTVVIKYVNELHPSLLMYCLNYNMRKKLIDTIKTSDI